MSATARIIRMSSKGQVVIPASLRRQLRLKTGQPLSIQAGPRDELILKPVDRGVPPVDEMLRRLRKAAREIGRDLLDEFHERRREDRMKEARKHDRRRH